jgi:hypothetical protein
MLRIIGLPQGVASRRQLIFSIAQTIIIGPTTPGSNV